MKRKSQGFWLTLLLVALFVWPLLPGVQYDLVNTAILACEYLIVALSLVLLIGMIGQISLCQAALVGMGAFISALATRKLGVQFPATLVIGLAAGALTATIVGVVALRVRGLYLAVATLIFAYVCDQYLFVQPWLVGSESGTSIPFEAIGRPGTLPYFDLGDAHVFYYIALAVAATALYAVANLRDSRLGRAFAAIRGSEVAAASLGIAVTRFKLLGFACAGALAGLSGTLTLVGSRTVAPEQFNFTNSLYFLAIAVVGGLRSIGGALASCLIFAILVGEVFFRFPILADYLDVISAGLLIGVLLFFRGGLGALPQRWPTIRSRLVDSFSEVRARVRRGDGGDVATAPAWTPWRRISRAIVSGADRFVAGIRDVLSGRTSRIQLKARGRTGAGLVQAIPAGRPNNGPIDVVGLMARLADGEDNGHQPHLRIEPPASAAVALREAEPTELGAADLLRRAAAQGITAGAPGGGGRRGPLLLEAEHITVRFGGLVAVNDVSLCVGAGEIVGLIGPNGAGKTTLFNSILGLNTPTQGRVRLLDQDVTLWDVHRRAALGVGRTFQILQLFGDLTVFDNLLVATHLQNRTGLWGSLVVSPRARRHEFAARERVEAVLDLMGLQEFSGRHVNGLPFGVLRLIEVARTLVAGARLVCFDEPASGLDSAETERLLEWFGFLRHIGITLLVIEHDVSFVVRLCDHIYVLDQGRLLASGTAAQVQRDPAVVASYLGAATEVVA